MTEIRKEERVGLRQGLRPLGVEDRELRSLEVGGQRNEFGVQSSEFRKSEDNQLHRYLYTLGKAGLI
jgi:hypothetical protein